MTSPVASIDTAAVVSIVTPAVSIVEAARAVLRPDLAPSSGVGGPERPRRDAGEEERRGHVLAVRVAAAIDRRIPARDEPAPEVAVGEDHEPLFTDREAGGIHIAAGPGWRSGG